MNRNNLSRLNLFGATVLSVVALLSPAAQAASHGTPPAQASAPATSADMTDAEVRKVDREAGKVTLKHGDIKSLDMPAMTMVFQVRNKAMLDKLQPGTRIQFKAANEGGKFVVTELKIVQ
ncbi:MAG: copper-binding protein [Roseateles sp.]